MATTTPPPADEPAPAPATPPAPGTTSNFGTEEESTVTMFFPVEVKLTLDDHSQLVFAPGNQKVPEKFKDHPWLKANGVKPADDSASTSEHSSATTSSPSSSSASHSSSSSSSSSSPPSDDTSGSNPHATRKGK